GSRPSRGMGALGPLHAARGHARRRGEQERPARGGIPLARAGLRGGVDREARAPRGTRVPGRADAPRGVLAEALPPHHEVREGFRSIRERLEKGATIGEGFLAETTFPTEVRESASVGATTGKLDEQLQGARRRLENETNTQRQLLLTLVPVIVYLVVAAAI